MLHLFPYFFSFLDNLFLFLFFANFAVIITLLSYIISIPLSHEGIEVWGHFRR